MQAHKRRLALLGRLSRMREAERQDAVLRLAEANGIHVKLLHLQARSGEIAASHAARVDACDGGELAGQIGFMAGLDAIVRQTAAEGRKAGENSDSARQHLVQADRRLDQTSERIGAERRAGERVLQTHEASANPILARKLNSR